MSRSIAAQDYGPTPRQKLRELGPMMH